MAILEALPGIEITIESQGKALPEYGDDAEWAQWAEKAKLPGSEEKWISTFVECVTNTDLGIRIILQPSLEMSSECLSFSVHIDGQGIGELPIDKKSLHGKIYSVVMCNACVQSGPHGRILKALKFAGIQKDSTKVKSDAMVAANIGEIVVRIYRSRSVPYYDSKCEPLRDAPAEIAEKALKGRAISNAVAFGKETTRAKSTTKSVYIDGHANPIGILVFKYRSREALHQEHIIPRSPSPDFAEISLNPQCVDGSLLTREERIARLQREMDELKNEGDVRVKHENDRKRSAENDLLPAREYKTIRKRNGGIIYDLTEED